MKSVEIRHHRRDDREYSSSRVRLHNNEKKSDRDFSSHSCNNIRSLIVEFSMTLLILKETISLVRSENCTLSVRFIRERAAMKIDYK
jgi:transcription elongation factor Elf1